MKAAEEMQHWKVREGNEKDMEEIFSLRRNAFGEMEKDKLDPRFWRWQFMEGPAGKGLIHIVEDKGKVVGHFSDLPRWFSLRGEKVRGTLSIDLMVHSDYRRKGIFQAMGRYAIQRVKNDNDSFMMSYPIRQETIQGFKKIGWEEVEGLPVLAFPIRFSGIVNRYLHFSPLSLLAGGVARFFYSLLNGLNRGKGTEGVEIEKVGLLDDQFDSFFQKALSLCPMMGIRNRNYLTWRYLQHPTRNYSIFRAKNGGEMQGYIVLRKAELLNFNSAVIVDLLALDEVTLTALVENGIKHSQQEGADLLGFMVPKTHLYYSILRRMGFLHTFKTFFLMIYSHEREKGLFDPKAWYVTWGDTDVI
jgi:GNAT superfamily N-acetyltransferase